jgi:hypothetical protein
MTSLNVPERMDELSAGVIRSFKGRRGSISGIPDNHHQMQQAAWRRR